MNQAKIKALVDTWLGGERTMFDACTEEPELAWRAVLALVESNLNQEGTALLAAGPLETLLVWHSSELIDRVELEAHRNPKFKHLLGGVWRQDIPEDIWQRIEAARQEAW